MRLEPQPAREAGAPQASGLEVAIRRDGFAFVRAEAMRATLGANTPLADWPAFAASWDALGLDTYMADGGRYRRRRYAVYAAVAEGDIARAPHQPHDQSLSYNALNGGIERWFEPILPAIGAGASLQAVLHYCRDLFGRLAPATRRWHIEVHQFRIEARADQPGRPTPEGTHRDGVDFVLVLLVRRHNIRSGTTSIHDAAGKELGSFTLSEPFDAALVDDHRCFHGVTPVEPLDSAQPAYRDVLVVTFRAA
jgi:hypothetical protein